MILLSKGDLQYDTFETDVENVCEVLEVMWHVSSSLKHLCLQYIFQNFDLVQNTEAFAALPEVMKLEIIQRFDKDNEGMACLKVQLLKPNLNSETQSHSCHLLELFQAKI